MCFVILAWVLNTSSLCLFAAPPNTPPSKLGGDTQQAAIFRSRLGQVLPAGVRPVFLFILSPLLDDTIYILRIFSGQRGERGVRGGVLQIETEIYIRSMPSFWETSTGFSAAAVPWCDSTAVAASRIRTQYLPLSDAEKIEKEKSGLMTPTV